LRGAGDILTLWIKRCPILGSNKRSLVRGPDNHQLNVYYRKEKGITLSAKQLSDTEAAVEEYKDSLTRRNRLHPKPTHKKRRRDEFDRLSNAITGLSSDTRTMLVRLADHIQVDLLSVIEHLPELEKLFTFVESKKPNKTTTDKDLQLLILSLAEIYKDAFGQKAAATRDGPFQTFVEKASGLRVNDKTIGSALDNWSGIMRIWDGTFKDCPVVDET
jgi:hypothetical protein